MAIGISLRVKSYHGTSACEVFLYRMQITVLPQIFDGQVGFQAVAKQPLTGGFHSSYWQYPYKTPYLETAGKAIDQMGLSKPSLF